MVDEGKWPGTELAACRLLSLEKFLWRLCTTRAAARMGRWEEAREHGFEASHHLDGFIRSGTISSWTVFEISGSLDGVGTSIYNQDAVWVEKYVEEVLGIVTEFVNPEFVRWIKTGSPEDSEGSSGT